MSSPRSLFEIQSSNILQEGDSIFTYTAEEVIIEEVVESSSDECQVNECQKVASEECCEQVRCNSYQHLSIVLIAFIAIFIIYYLGNRCHNNEWFNKHIHKCDWIAYSETNNM